MPNSFSLEHLTPTEFEQFIYELMHSLGFRNLNWRKGSNTGSSVSDQGRDLEATLQRTEIDGTVHTERWFAECKHRQKAIPPAELGSFLAWCNAERPTVALVAVSGFLSNPTKNYLNSYRDNNRPTFRVKTWEAPDLERLSAGKLALTTRFSLSSIPPHLNLLHPLHAHFLKKPPVVSVADVFREMESQ